MIKYFKKFFLYIIILLLLVEPCYGYTVYSYSGIKAPTNYSSAYLYSGVAYSGTLYEPIIYNGEHNLSEMTSFIKENASRKIIDK